MNYTVQVVNIDEKNIILNMIDVYNKAFLARKNSYNKNPFTKVEPTKFYEALKSAKKEVVVAIENGKVIGGLCFQIKQIVNSNQMCYISDVCVAPEAQGKGVAKAMLNFVIEQAKNKKCDFLELVVGGIWGNTVRLYKGLGFVPVKISAHLPQTYYLIGMRKFLGKSNWLSIKFSYFISRLKFSLLFKKDSSPKFLHKLIFR